VSLLIGCFTVLCLTWAAVRERELGLFRFFDVSQSCATTVALIISEYPKECGVLENALHAEVDFGYGG